MSPPRPRRATKDRRKGIPRDQVEVRLRSCDSTVGVTVEELAELDVSNLVPVRSIPSYTDQASIPRLPYLFCLDDHVHVESGLERDCAIQLELSSHVDCIVPQAMGIPIVGVPGHRRHVIDLLSRDDRGIHLWMVRPAQHFRADDGAVFRKVQEMCDVLGWSVEIFSGNSPTKRANLRLLMHSRRMPISAPDLAPIMIAAAGAPGATVGLLLRQVRAPRPVVLGVLWHLLAWRHLTADLEAPLDHDSPLDVGPCPWSGDRLATSLVGRG